METAIPTEARWRRAPRAEAHASCRASAPCYRLTKDVGFVPVVVTERGFIEIEGQIFLRYMVERADDATLKQGPEAIDILRMNLAPHVLGSAMSHAVVRVLFAKALITVGLIGRDQFNAICHDFTHEPIKGGRIGRFDHLANDIALPADGSDHGNLAGCALGVRPDPLVAMLVFLFATHKGFVHFDYAHQLLKVGIDHASPQPMAHVPSRARRGLFAEEHAANLARRNALLALEHRVENLEPSHERMLGILEYRPCRNRKSVGVATPTSDIRTLPFPRLRDLVDVIRPAA